tara:strand:+ start:2133 stop:2663 length:531 start_codon:yes stop_codon:yes gene_type:complete
MLSVEQFKLRLIRPNHPDWLLVGVDDNDESQLYILSNGGMANINCAPIELYAIEIKHCAQEMIALGDLFLKENEKSVRIGNGRSVYSYSLKSNSNALESTSANQHVYFSSTFIRWQRSHQVSDKITQEKLGLNADEFHQFREDELNISEDLMAKLAEVTGSSIQVWKNLKDRNKRS